MVRSRCGRPLMGRGITNFYDRSADACRACTVAEARGDATAASAAREAAVELWTRHKLEPAGLGPLNHRQGQGEACPPYPSLAYCPTCPHACFVTSCPEVPLNSCLNSCPCTGAPRPTWARADPHHTDWRAARVDTVDGCTHSRQDASPLSRNDRTAAEGSTVRCTGPAGRIAAGDGGHAAHRSPREPLHRSRRCNGGFGRWRCANDAPGARAAPRACCA